MARRRLALLRVRLREVAARRGVMRQQRSRSAMPAVALAGYTNVGKSTLLNALTGSDVSVDDRLFETLDPTTRAFREDGRAYLVTDTVGFIGKLPHTLVEAFAATLEETLAGDLVLLVADASSGEEGLQRQLSEVREVLADIGASDLPSLLVINKIDTVDAAALRRLRNRFADAVLISARTGAGLDELKQRIAAFFSGRYVDVQLLVPHGQGGELSALYATGAPITAREDGAEGVLVTARLPRGPVRRLPRMTDLLVRRIHPDAHLPAGAYPGDAGLDLASVEEVTLAPGERATVATGLAVAIPDGHAGFVQPRSGLAARHGITVVNSPGLVDSGYRGELKVVLLNTDRDEAFHVRPGDRIAQLVVVAVPEVAVLDVDELPPSERSERGFGSSAVGRPR
jgi:deoxyuridine 5'-triphosphate nucleotidohydrolase